MATEASKAEATKRPEPAFRKPNQTRAGRLRQEMIDGYAQALGGRVSPIVMQDITRAVDLIMLANTVRADLLAGRTTINDVVKLEGAADRAVRRLNLPVPGRSKSAIKYGRPESVPTITDYLAERQAEDE